MKLFFNLYRALATIVGVSIITLIVVGTPLKFGYKWWPGFAPGFFEQGGHAQKLGSDIDLYLGTAHGFIYMGYLLVTFALSRVARWPIIFTIVTLVCGTVPFLSFWAEAHAIKITKRRYPQLR